MLQFLTGLYQRIPTFMSSYVSKTMEIVLQASVRDESSDLTHLRQVLLQVITQNIMTDICVESLLDSWSTLVAKRKVDSPYLLSDDRC
jgi:hypothetical protein